MATALSIAMFIVLLQKESDMAKLVFSSENSNYVDFTYLFIWFERHLFAFANCSVYLISAYLFN